MARHSHNLVMFDGLPPEMPAALRPVATLGLWTTTATLAASYAYMAGLGSWGGVTAATLNVAGMVGLNHVLTRTDVPSTLLAQEVVFDKSGRWPHDWKLAQQLEKVSREISDRNFKRLGAAAFVMAASITGIIAFPSRLTSAVTLASMTVFMHLCERGARNAHRYAHLTQSYGHSRWTVRYRDHNLEKPSRRYARHLRYIIGARP